MKVQVLLRLKSGVLDVQGKAVERGMHELGFTAVSQVRIGKIVELEIDEPSEETARKVVEDACKQFLANLIIEQYEIRILPS